RGRGFWESWAMGRGGVSMKPRSVSDVVFVGRPPWAAAGPPAGSVPALFRRPENRPKGRLRPRGAAPQGVVLAALVLASALSAAKLTFEERTEIVRGLMAEFATAKVPLPRAKKPLEVSPGGKYSKETWTDAMQQNGPAARVGDMIQITKVDIENDRLVLEINNGMKGKRRGDHKGQGGAGTRPSASARGGCSKAPRGPPTGLGFV